ncbi:MAG: HPF/RaiA family ribosome-associated protein [Candidatus Paceibacterota bacterium]|jgi:ribosomal subunit interface protein
MKIIVKSTGLELSEALNEFISIKLSSLSKFIVKFEKKSEAILKVEVARSTKHRHKGDVYYVELSLALPKNDLRIEQYDEDIRSGIDKAKRKMALEIKKIDDKHFR